VIVDDGVDVGGSQEWAAVLVAGSVWCRGPVPAALGASDVAPAAAVGHVSELFDVDVEHRARVVVFVAADRLAGGVVDV
jgi:hypothetical protein